jgi:hypothetical protein
LAVALTGCDGYFLTWHVRCVATSMSTLTDTEQAVLFFPMAACLGACFIRAFWEMEQARERRRLQRDSRNRSQFKNLGQLK